MAFDFAGAEAWEVATEQLLPVGSHLCKIRNPMTSETSTGKPQIELQVQNSQGSLRDWLVITPNTVGKIVQLFDAAGVHRPQAGEFDPQTGALSPGCVDRLHGRDVGVVVGEEPSFSDPAKLRRRVQGYRKPEDIASDVPIDTTGLSEPQKAAWEDPIPF